MKALVVYESMFGNTEAVADAIGRGLAQEGAQVTRTEVSQAPRGLGVEADLVVVGAPTHAFSLSWPSTRRDAVRQGAPAARSDTGLREWIGDLDSAEGAGRLVAVFDTRASKVRRLPKSAATRAARLLARRGYRLVAKPIGFLVDDVRGPLVPGELERATAWGRSIAVEARTRLTDPASAPA